MTDRQWPQDSDPYYFAAMLDEELHRVQVGVATEETIKRARNTFEEGVAAIAAGEYAGYKWTRDVAA